MDDTSEFRKKLLTKMLRIAGVGTAGLLGVSAAQSGCGGIVRVDPGGAGGSGGASTNGSGGTAGGGGVGGPIFVGSASSAGGGTIVIDAGPMIAHRCMAMDDAGV